MLIPVTVKYVSVGPSGEIFSVWGISVNKDSDPVIECTADDDFTCTPLSLMSVSGNVTLNDNHYFNASFTINPASSSDAGEYVVRVIAQDILTTSGSTTMTYSTLTMTLSASATTPPRKCELIPYLCCRDSRRNGTV